MTKSKTHVLSARAIKAVFSFLFSFSFSTVLATAWTKNADLVVADIVEGWQNDDGSYMAVLSFRLAPGWKTYWRAPGETGIPPVLDWYLSSNLEDIELSWPTPKIFDEGKDTQVIGYQDQLTIPIRFNAKYENHPVDIHLKANIGVCKDVCVPISLTISKNIPSFKKDPKIVETAIMNLPISAEEAKVKNKQCIVETMSSGLRITAKVTLPAISEHETLLIETGLQNVWTSYGITHRKGDALIATSDIISSNFRNPSLSLDQVVMTIIGENGHGVDIAGCSANEQPPGG